MKTVWIGTAALAFAGLFAAGCIHDASPSRDGGSGSINISGTGGNGDGGTGANCGAALYEPPSSGPVLASGNVAVDAQAIYWIDEIGQVLRVPKAGGAAQVLAKQEAVTSLVARNLALRDDVVYFTDATNVGYIKRVAKAGGAVTTLVTTATSADEIHLDASYIYWSTALEAGSPVWRAPLEGGDAIPLASNYDFTATPTVAYFDLDDANIYVTLDRYDKTVTGAVYRMAKDGSDITALATGVDEPFYVTAIDPDYLYFGMHAPSDAANPQAPTDGKVARVPKAATGPVAPEIIAAGQDGPAQIGVDGGNLYWINFGGVSPYDGRDSTIVRAPKPPAAPPDAGASASLTQLADCTSGSQSFAIDDTSVYYLDGDGRIRKIAK